MARSDGGVADHLEKNAHVLRVLNLVVLSHTIWTQVGIPKKILRTMGTYRFGWGSWQTHRNISLPTYVTIPNLAALGQTVL